MENDIAVIFDHVGWMSGDLMNYCSCDCVGTIALLFYEQLKIEFQFDRSDVCDTRVNFGVL